MLPEAFVCEVDAFLREASPGLAALHEVDDVEEGRVAALLASLALPPSTPAMLLAVQPRGELPFQLLYTGLGVWRVGQGRRYEDGLTCLQRESASYAAWHMQAIQEALMRVDGALARPTAAWMREEEGEEEEEGSEGHVG